MLFIPFYNLKERFRTNLSPLKLFLRKSPSFSLSFDNSLTLHIPRIHPRGSLSSKKVRRRSRGPRLRGGHRRPNYTCFSVFLELDWGWGVRRVRCVRSLAEACFSSSVARDPPRIAHSSTTKNPLTRKPTSFAANRPSSWMGRPPRHRSVPRVPIDRRSPIVLIPRKILLHFID